MERLGVPLASANIFGWGNAIGYARTLCSDPGSHTWRAINSEFANYASTLHLAAQLADIYDAIQALYISLTTPRGKRPRPLEPYPRPWRKPEVERIGSGAIPVSEFESWYYGGD